MTKAIGVFGIPDEKFCQRVLELRKMIHDLKWDSGEAYLETLPHLTLSVNKKFDGKVADVVSILMKVGIETKKFELTTRTIRNVDKNLAIYFDNSYSKLLAKNITIGLHKHNFLLVETNFMKLIRSVVKEKYVGEARKMLRSIIPKTIMIDRIVIAGGLIREKDIVKSYNMR